MLSKALSTVASYESRAVRDDCGLITRPVPRVVGTAEPMITSDYHRDPIPTFGTGESVHGKSWCSSV